MAKTVLITGASSGIGKASAKLFAAKGWQVIATMRDPEKETELKDMLVTRLDVQDHDSIREAIATGIAQSGHIDLLINNAGYGEFGIFETTSTARIRNQFDVNLFGLMHTIQAILPHFRAQGAGMIMNISSGAGRFTLPLLSLYCASKFALEGFSEALSYELSALGITVKIIEPGGTSTNFNQVAGERYAEKEQITDYDTFLTASNKMFDMMKSMQLLTPEEVAATIFEAATDGKDQLRYTAGNPDYQKRMQARLTMPDQEYIQSVRNYYARFL